MAKVALADVQEFRATPAVFEFEQVFDLLPVLPPEEGPALRGAAGREHPLSGAAPAFRVRHPQDAPPVLG